jgi:23S rRNA pseudouridine1911/1915/1917 synthase
MRYAPRPAMTRYAVEKREGAYALVRAEAARAARHQIRAHFAAIGHPLVGDELYGGAAAPGLGRHALHASRARFDADASLSFDVASPLPEDMSLLLG